MSKLIEKKNIKVSNRGITFSFNNKNNENQFGIGDHYIIDVKNNKMVILPTDDGLKISKKKVGKEYKPLIDIRNQAALSSFKGADYLEVTIFDDKILVEGYKEDKSLVSKIRRGLKSVSSKRKVVDIHSFAKVKKIASAYMTKEQLQKVSGSDITGQLSIFDESTRVFSESTANYESYGSNAGNFKSGENVVNFGSKLPDLKYPMQIVSLFSGAGIFDKGFIEEGFEVVFALELNPDAAKTYEMNIGDHVVCDSVCTYPKIDVPDAKIIIGGPSCRPFSKARFDYNTEKGQIKNHPDSMLVHEYIKWVKSEYANYDIFVMENVPELLTASEGAYLSLIKEELSDFEISHGIVTDVEQGGYQKRKRAIIIGSKIGKVEIPSPKFSKDNFKTMGDALDKVDDSWPNQKDVSIPGADVVERMKYVPQGGNWRDIPEHLRTKGKHSNTYKRLSLDEPCITLVNYRKPIITHPLYNRILTVSEAAAATGLEKDFKFYGTLSAKQQQVGNAVPVFLARSIAKSIKDTIHKYLNQKLVMSNS